MLQTGVIGVGCLGEAVLKELSESRGYKRDFGALLFYHPRKERCQEIEEKGYGRSVDLEKVLRCDVIFLLVKPSQIEDLLEKIVPLLETKPLFISGIAGVPLSYLESKLGKERIIRMMTNLIGFNNNTKVFYYPATESIVPGVLSYLGSTELCHKEKTLDVATPVFGSGPAFIARLYQAYLRSSLKFYQEADIHRYDIIYEDDISELFAMTTQKISSPRDAEEIIRKIASPGGSTQKGLEILETLEDLLLQSFEVSYKRCQEIREEFLLKIME